VKKVRQDEKFLHYSFNALAFFSQHLAFLSTNTKAISWKGSGVWAKNDTIHCFTQVYRNAMKILAFRNLPDLLPDRLIVMFFLLLLL
jgi:hypothetical protein